MPSRTASCLLLFAPLLISLDSSLATPARSDDAQTQSQGSMSDVEKAEEWMRKADSADRAGRREEALRSFEEAVKLFQLAISRNPAYAGLWKKLGQAYWLSDKRNEALAAYKQAYRLRSEDAETHYMLGKLQFDVLQTALAEYREAVRLEPENPRYHLDLGLALAENKEIYAAITAIEEAIRLDPENGESHAMLGRVRFLNGDMETAISEYRKALTLNLTESSAARVRQSLEAALETEENGNRNITDANYWVRRVNDWRKAAIQHKPGMRDDAAVAIGGWPIRDLDIVIGLLGTLNGQRKVTKPIEISDVLKKDFQVEILAHLRGDTISPYTRLASNLNAVLKRGALLHADIARLQLETGSANDIDRPVSLTNDGLGTEANRGQHWELARRALFGISPHPSKDEHVRQWYIATTAYMLGHRKLAYADDHIKRGLELFPDNPDLLFYAGVLREKYAAPKSQNAMPPPGMKFQFGLKKNELELAQQLLLKALAAKPDFAEAHLRLGRVTGLLGNHKAAVAELNTAAGALTDSQLRYYTFLYLGYEFEALGRNAEARTNYDRAADLYPSAPSPLLAASHLAHSSGDAAGALAGVQQVFGLPDKYAERYDPWWEYDIACARNSGALLEEMNSQFGRLLQ